MKKGDMVRRITARGKFLTPPLRVKRASGALILCVNAYGIPYCYRRETLKPIDSISVKVSKDAFDAIKKGGTVLIHEATPQYTKIKKYLKKGDCLCIYCNCGMLFKVITHITAHIKRRVKNQGYCAMNTTLTYKIHFEK